MIHRIGTTIGAFLRIAIIIVCYVWVALAPKRNGAGDGQLIWYYISSRGESLISDKPIRIASSQEELTKTKCQQRGHDPSKSLQRPPPSALRRYGHAESNHQWECRLTPSIGCGVRQMHCCRLQCSAQRYVRKGIHAAERLLFGMRMHVHF